MGKKACPVCQGRQRTTIYHIDQIPANQNITYSKEQEALSAVCGSIELVCCERCGFVYNAAFDERSVLYGTEYNNDQSASGLFYSYITRQIDWILEKYIQEDDTVAEIGCGKGYYIKALASKSKGCGNRYGFDTSYDGALYDEAKSLRYYTEYYTSKYLPLDIDFFICRHVIEHIEYPIAFLSSLRNSMKEGTLVFFETPNFDWIVQNKVAFDICYEHCSYFNSRSFKYALALAGFDVVECFSGFGGQYMCFVAQPGNNESISTIQAQEALPLEKDTRGQIISQMFCVDDMIKEYTNELTMIKARGKKTAIWGAGSKGCIFLNMTDKARMLVDCVIDINESKQGKFIGVTGHRIISPYDINSEGIDHILIMNPNYSEEISSLLQKLQVEAEIGKRL